MENAVKPCCVMLESCTPKNQIGLSAELQKEIQARNLFTCRTKKKLLKELNSLNVANIECNHKFQRQKVINEIVSSEDTYVKKLELVRNYFMNPLKERYMLSTDDFDTLFCNIVTIYNISCELLRELKSTEDVVEAFSKIVPFFKHYSFYGYHYKQSLNLLQQLSMKNAAFVKFLDMQESRPEVQSKLSALLITPIQRVPRYCLLLEQLLENTSSSHHSYFQISELLKNVESTALHINSLIEDQENAQLMLELQRSLLHGFPAIIRPGRKLLKKGILTELAVSKEKKQKRCFVLMSDIIMYCKIKKPDINASNALKCSGILPLNKCKLTENLNKGAFKITCEEETLVVYHEKAHEAREWVQAINERISKYMSERRTLRKDSSARRPAINKRSLSDYEEIGVSPGIPRKKRFIKDENFKVELNGSKSQQDCLFPLRELHRKDVESRDVPEVDDKRVFVFGARNQQRGFRFGMMNVLSGIGSSFRKFFNLTERTN